MDGLQFFRNRVIVNSGAQWLTSPPYLIIEQYWKDAVNSAHRLELEIRDYMQLVGGLSINESRKSIELSNVQIQEGKQGLFISWNS